MILLPLVELLVLPGVPLVLVLEELPAPPVPEELLAPLEPELDPEGDPPAPELVP